MRKFLFNVIYFLLFLLVCNSILNYAGNKLYMSNYKKYSLNFRSYLLSDSHALPLKNMIEGYGVYNFSSGSESYYDMKRKLNFLIKNTLVDTVYINVDDHSLNNYRDRLNNLDRSVYYSTLSDYDNMVSYLRDKMIFHVAFFNPKKRTLLKRYISNYFVSSKNNKTPLDIKETRTWFELNTEERFASAKKRYEYQFSKTQKSTKLQHALEEIIQICEDNNIVLIGIKFPLTQEYAEFIEEDILVATDLFKKRKLKILDYSKIFEKEPQYFYDQDHLNKIGAKELISKMFVNDM